VVWLNKETGVYHYQGSHWYGNTKHGAYMCETDSLRAGKHAAKNEPRPQRCAIVSRETDSRRFMAVIFPLPWSFTTASEL